MVHIAGGALKGLTLTVPKQIRATEGRVRQALFNIVGSVEGMRIIDAFAGSGAMGLEALSRGAQLVQFLESDRGCLEAIQRNLARIQPETIPGSGVVIQGDALRNLRRLAEASVPYDLIIVDPPYQGPWGKKALNVVAACAMLAPSGLICVEHARRNELPAIAGPLTALTQHRYGETVLSFYRARG